MRTKEELLEEIDLATEIVESITHNRLNGKLQGIALLYNVKHVVNENGQMMVEQLAYPLYFDNEIVNQLTDELRRIVGENAKAVELELGLAFLSVIKKNRRELGLPNT